MEARAPDGSAADLKLVAHPRAKSKVWKYFGFDTNADGCILHWKRIYCRICMAQIAYSGNTSNLSYHLEKNHPEEFCEFIKSNTEQMREAFATAFSKLKPEASTCGPQTPPDAAMAASAGVKAGHGLDSKRQHDLSAAVLGLICDGLYPASIVDEPTFRALLRTAEPRYELPGRKFFTGKAIPERCAVVRHAVAKELAEMPWCGLSADTWTSHSQNRTYVTLAAHFLAADTPGCLALGSRCLKTFEVPEDNRADSITRVLYETFVQWGISSKVVGATTDAGRDIGKACSLLDIAVQMPCLAHTFEAAVQQAFRLPKLAGLLARCGRLVEYFQQSPVALYMLGEKQKQQGSAAPRMLRSARVGRWGSTLGMLQRLQEQQFAVAGVLVEDSNNHHLMLEAAEWATVEGLVQLLQPFQQVAEVLSASRYPTVSMVKPLLHMLLTSTLTAKDTDSKEISMAKEVIARELAGAYREPPDVDMFLNVATFLDPRYKRLPFLSAFERQQVEKRVVEEAEALLEKAKDGSFEPQPPPEDRVCPAAVSEEPAAKKPALAASSSIIHDMLAEIFCQTGGADAQEERHAQVLEELSNFKSQKLLALHEDPLRWWADRRALFPLLPRVLQKYWCVAATRAPAQRLFASSANVLSTKRNRLSPAHVDQQIFLYENARCQGGSAGVDAELEEEDEGDWGVDQEQLDPLGDTGGGGFFGGRDASLL
ncbi:zinc finger BED domain-containing protein 1 [Heterocephalus glaber]|uniref:Zinc finger BED domain-containing protein 1 n=1 Tax=Heterocephalus glaber TaxID=10181 RepID=A0AAX6Q7K8_HETGA|nr:zinc finger BED domain-containing protein 1 [Heterocephalus glaber]XP_004867375.1 zinc finger BED domain-containing protein 1 [Heterocephalus glaber]XP_012921948.1 zinc finger BED domain-containing protein 1 [Heterocephalus glaber]XP_021102011.1 zinc finger BED domain-containing protein 1 [Heterocephalus glaber]